MPFVWLPKSPVRKVESAEFSRLCLAFRRDTAAWLVPHASSEEQRQWNERISMAHLLSDWAFGSDYFACLVGSRPVGLAAVERSDAPSISVSVLVAHPGQQGAGSILVEHIVNCWPPQSLRLELVSLVETRLFYQRLGFEPVIKNEMRLEVAKSPRWIRVDGKWRLAAYAHLPNYGAFIEKDEDWPISP
jgi:GNAT superfamily N-acetyltransferase